MCGEQRPQQARLVPIRPIIPAAAQQAMGGFGMGKMCGPAGEGAGKRGEIPGHSRNLRHGCHRAVTAAGGALEARAARAPLSRS